MFTFFRFFLVFMALAECVLISHCVNLFTHTHNMIWALAAIICGGGLGALIFLIKEEFK